MATGKGIGAGKLRSIGILALPPSSDGPLLVLLTVELDGFWTTWFSDQAPDGSTDSGSFLIPRNSMRMSEVFNRASIRIWRRSYCTKAAESIAPIRRRPAARVSVFGLQLRRPPRLLTPARVWYYDVYEVMYNSQ
jgi:hypothetical protein